MFLRQCVDEYAGNLLAEVQDISVTPSIANVMRCPVDTHFRMIFLLSLGLNRFFSLSGHLFKCLIQSKLGAINYRDYSCKLAEEFFPLLYFGLARYAVVITSCASCFRDFVSARAVTIKIVRFLLFRSASFHPLSHEGFSESVGLF